MIPGYLTFEDIEKYMINKISKTVKFKDVHSIWINSYDEKGIPPQPMDSNIYNIYHLLDVNDIADNDKEKMRNFLGFLYNSSVEYEKLKGLAHYVEILNDAKDLIDGAIDLDAEGGILSEVWQLSEVLSDNKLLTPDEFFTKRLKDKRNIDLIRLQKSLAPYYDKSNRKHFGYIVDDCYRLITDRSYRKSCMANIEDLAARGIDLKMALSIADACNIKLSYDVLEELKKILPVTQKADRFKKAKTKTLIKAAEKTKKIDIQKKR